jgi:multisubunit Na+/H+ antiporter MnhE subunit
VARIMAEIVVWWAIACSIWMISLSEAPLQEYLLAVGCGLPAAMAAFWARRAVQDSWTVRAEWVKPLMMLPLILVSDAAQVFLAVVRPGQPGGRFITVQTPAAGNSSRARSRRARDVFFMSVTPGSYVLDADPDTGEMLVHSLASKGPRMERHL